MPLVTFPMHTFVGDVIGRHKRGQFYSASVFVPPLDIPYVSRPFGVRDMVLPIFSDSSSRMDGPSPAAAGGDGGNNSTT